MAKRAERVRLGHKPAIAPELAERIRAERKGGATFQEIADRLNAEGVPTPRGGKEWRPSSLTSVLGGTGSSNFNM